MSGKHSEIRGDDSGKHRLAQSPGERVNQRLSPITIPPTPGSPGSSPRTSPGLLAGHYAGCKWSEPPSPSSLPLPPQHWMSPASSIKHHFPKQILSNPDTSHQLKVLLNVRA